VEDVDGAAELVRVVVDDDRVDDDVVDEEVVRVELVVRSGKSAEREAERLVELALVVGPSVTSPPPKEPVPLTVEAHPAATSATTANPAAASSARTRVGRTGSALMLTPVAS
jgi:hypothetical protein